ncbi:MAG: PadR family transcriptional regulator [Bryobacteraceae bacterium]|nr:PadR family transcriptional regulator [Bryobacteraceae bacterium]
MGERIELLQGTLDMLILRTLLFGPVHGHGIARHIQRTSDEVLQVEHGSLYPALHRLERKGWISAKWQKTETGREMKFYRLTAKGRKQLNDEKSKWEAMVSAIARVMKPAAQ